MIIKGKFKKHDGFGGKSFHYLTDLDLQVGDIVEVPTAHGDAILKVSGINIDKKEIEAFKDVIKTVISKKIITNAEYYKNMPPEELLEKAIDTLCNYCEFSQLECEGSKCDEALAEWLESEWDGVE